MKKKSLKILSLTLILMIMMMGTISTQKINAQNLSEDQAFQKIFKYEKSELNELFAESFLKQVPLNQLYNILQKYKTNLGKLNKINKNQNQYTLIFEKGTAPARISINTDNKINGLWFGNWTLKSDKTEKIASELQNLNGKVSVAILKNNKKPLLTINEKEKLAVGSSFKLYVLKSLYEKVDDNQWNKVIRLNENNMSLPSGILNDWEVGSPLTLKTLANLMISISDNTATDHLIDYIGRDYLEKNTNQKNRPFLKTNELFRIKYMVNKNTREKYINANLKEKRNILQNIKDKKLKVNKINNKPTHIKELEWFFSTKQLCNIIYNLKRSDSIYINSGLANKDNWYRAGFKGGSEPGVLQYTHLLQKTNNSDIYTISVTVNNSEKNINKSKVNELVTRLISLIKNNKI